MIFLDSAATSFQKPPQVRRAMVRAMKTMSSPGRGGYPSAMRAADLLLDCRTALGELFHVPAPESVVFTGSATHGLNIAVRSLVQPGDTVVVSGYEHNAVMRPLTALRANIRVAASPLFDQDAAVEAFARALPGASAAVCCHVSNVFGYILPLERIAALCRAEKVPLIVDASQSAGCLDLDFQALGAAFAAMPGHKGLLGPQGTGVLLCADRFQPLLYGGTGSQSAAPGMPDFLPDALEAGTHNVPGTAGLLAGVRWVERVTPAKILLRERELALDFAERVRRCPSLRLFQAEDPAVQTGVLSLCAAGTDGEALAQRLAEKSVCVRAGLHCAPAAHRTAGTLDGGTVRFSFSPFNTPAQTRRAADILARSVR